MKTNTTEVRLKVQQHILEQTDGGIMMLYTNAKAVMGMRETPTLYHAIAYTVDSGNFLIYHFDVHQFLTGLGLNNADKNYTDSESWALYKHLIATNAEKMIKKANLI